MPAHSPGDLPSHLAGEGVASILAAWTSAWRPDWIAHAGGAPKYVSDQNLPPVDGLEGHIVIVPRACDTHDTAEWLDQACAAPGARVVRPAGASRSAVYAALAAPPCQNSVAEDFWALGFAWLQVSRLCERMGGHAPLDAAAFADATVAAARAAEGGDADESHARLAAAFDLLSEARGQVVSSEWQLIDMTLLAPSVLGEPLAAELRRGTVQNILLSGRLADRLATEHGESAELLRAAAGAGKLSVAGGAMEDTTLADYAPEPMLQALRDGFAAVERLVGVGPTAFASFAGGVPPRLPAALAGIGCQRVLLTAFDGSALPWPDQARTKWTGIDGTELQAICAPPTDAGRPEAAWRLCDDMAGAVAHDWAGTLLYAAWPGGRHESFVDWRRVATWTDALGKFVTLDGYFETRPNADHWTHVEGDQLGRRKPVSAKSPAEQRDAPGATDSLTDGLIRLAGASDPPGLMGSLKLTQAEPSSTGRVTINPWSFPVATPHGAVPGLGYRSFSTDAARADGPPRAEERTLRSETIEALVSDRHGGLASIRVHGRRKPVAAQRLVVHGSGPLQEAECDVRVNQIEVTASDALGGAIRSTGDLLDRMGDRVATFEQTATLPARSGVIRIELLLDQARSSRLTVASRLAWSDGQASIARGVQWARIPQTGREVFTSEYVDIRNDPLDVGGIVLVVEGLSHHRCVGQTRLDTPIPKQVQKLKAAVGIGPTYATHVALGEGWPPQAWPVAGVGPEASSSWWMLVDAKNVLVSSLSVESASRESDAGQPASRVFLRLMETEGRSAVVRLRCWRAFQRAWLTDFRGGRLLELDVVDGAVPLDVAAYGWLQVEGAW